MIKQEIHIVGYDTLYNILIEIENNLSFSILNHSNENEITETLRLKKVDIKNSLFLTIKHKNYLINNLNIDKKNIFLMPNIPTEIHSLLENINIQLIKIRYNYQSKFFLKDYILDLNSREINRDNKKLKLTEKEIDTILFLKNQKNPQKIKTLLTEVWGYLKDIETHTVETHIHRLRKKILDKFQDDKFILSREDGYLIE